MTEQGTLTNTVTTDQTIATAICHGQFGIRQNAMTAKAHINIRQVNIFVFTFGCA